MRSHRDSSEEIPSAIQVVKKKPEPLSPRSFFFNKKSKQISPCNSPSTSPCNSRDPSPSSRSSRDPSPSSRSFHTLSPRQIPSNNDSRNLQEKKKSIGMSRSSSTPPPTTSSSHNFIPSQSNVQLSRRDSDTLESLGEQISNSSTYSNKSSNQTNSRIQSKKIVEYCKQLSRTESNSDSNQRNKKNPNPHLHLNLPADDSDDEGHSHDNPPEISPPRSNKSLPLSARARSNRNLLKKTDSPQSQSARSVDSPTQSSPTPAPTVAALIEYSKTLVRLTSSDTIGDITQDRVAYANHALRFAQTTLTSPISSSSTRTSEGYDDALYSTLLKSQSLLVQQPESRESDQDSHPHSSIESQKRESMDQQISDVKEFSPRRQSKFLRMKSWSPSTMKQTQDDLKQDKKSLPPAFLAKNRPVSSSRCLSSPTSRGPSRDVVEQDDEDPNRGNGDIRVRPRKTIVKRYSKDPSYDGPEVDGKSGNSVFDFEIDDF